MADTLHLPQTLQDNVGWGHGQGSEPALGQALLVGKAELVEDHSALILSLHDLVQSGEGRLHAGVSVGQHRLTDCVADEVVDKGGVGF